ncbi:MAG: hypothetical protein KA144_11470 [Xanthomonadaceae bacterium]|nr:hypothetical protein [Xanthomonadaceae bacterium]
MAPDLRDESDGAHAADANAADIPDNDKLDGAKIHMRPEDLDKIRKLIDQVIYASSKNAALPYVKQLEFASSMATSKLNPYFAGKLREAVIYAKQASGKSRHKKHLILCMENSWYVLGNHVKHDSSPESAT